MKHGYGGGMKKITDKKFKYTSAAESAKPHYLKNKWDRLYPGWRNFGLPKQKPSVVVSLKSKGIK